VSHSWISAAPNPPPQPRNCRVSRIAAASASGAQLRASANRRQDEKHGGGDAIETQRFEVVELNERHAGTMRANNDVALHACGAVERRWHGASEVGQAHAAPEKFLVAGQHRPCHVEARRAAAGECVEHRLRFDVAFLCAVISHSPSLFVFLSKILRSFVVRKTRVALAGHDSCPHDRGMFVVSEAEAAAIRTAFDQGGELSAAIELRRLFPGVGDNVQARACARTIAGWKPLPVSTRHCHQGERNRNHIECRRAGSVYGQNGGTLFRLAS
jgi:hypothetical protein